MRDFLPRFAIIIIFVPVLAAGAFVFPQKATAPIPMQANAPPETMQGTIDYMENLGGYFIRGENPGGEYFIVNQNPKVLKALKESKKTVTLQGYTTNQGAEYFFIQKIDGKKYTGAKPAK